MAKPRRKPTEAQIAAKKERLKNLKESLEDLAASIADPNHGDEAFNNYMKWAQRFWNYSLNNVMLVLWQWEQRRQDDPSIPPLSQIAPAGRWKSAGRNINAGEKALYIQRPNVFKVKETDPETGEEEITGNGIYFTTSPVFDISQTNGDEIPNWKKDLRDAAEYIPDLVAFAAGKNIPVTFDHLGVVNGMSHGGRIQINSSIAEGIQVQTLVHEIAHELLHQQAEGKKFKKEHGLALVEGEAEAVTTLVMGALGFDTVSNGAAYIRSYGCTSQQILDSFSRISRVAKPILEHLTGTNVETEEKNPEEDIQQETETSVFLTAILGAI